MKRSHLLLGLTLLALAASSALSSSEEISLATLETPCHQARNVSITAALPGEVYTGTIVSETEDELILDTDPCDGTRKQFQRPFTKENTGYSVECGSEALEVFAIEQKAVSDFMVE